MRGWRGLLAPLALTATTLWAAGVDDSPPPRPYEVEVYEDGSGVQYVEGREVKTFPEGTFAWDCSAMGNRICGSRVVQMKAEEGER